MIYKKWSEIVSCTVIHNKIEYVSIFDKLLICQDRDNITIQYRINPKIAESLTVKELFGKIINPIIQQ